MKGISVFDFVKSGNEKKYMKLGAKNGQNYFPEVLYRLYIINAPFGFKTLWNLISTFLDKATRERIQILGGDFKKILSKVIDKDKLHKDYGGTC